MVQSKIKLLKLMESDQGKDFLLKVIESGIQEASLETKVSALR